MWIHMGKEVIMVSNITSSDNSSSLQAMMAEMQKKMKAADTDGIQGLSKDELASIDTSGDSGGAAFIKSLTSQFDKLDSDLDGQLSSSEVAAARPHHHGHMGPPPGLEGLLEADTDGTEGLSKDELSSVNTSNDTVQTNFVNTLVKNFKTIDTDGNGQLSQREMMAYMSDNSQSTTQASNLGSQAGAFASSFIQKLIEGYKSGGFSGLASSVSVAG